MCKKCVHVCNNIALSGYLNDFLSNCYYEDSVDMSCILHARTGVVRDWNLLIYTWPVINAVENSKYFLYFFS